jgi:Flp pilus assembly pilin Flp
MRLFIRNRSAQSFVEYGLIIAVVVAALTVMGLYVQRSIKANLKLIEDQVNREVSGN